MTSKPPTPWYKRVGPGLITACVVIGPGSILTSSKVGANDAYSMLWIVVVSVIFMVTYMQMGAKLGVVAAQAPCDLLRGKAGGWLAISVGLCVFFISAAFQSGNNIGVAAAFETLLAPAAEEVDAPTEGEDGKKEGPSLDNPDAALSLDPETSKDGAPADPVEKQAQKWLIVGALVLFNLFAISFLFAFKNFYHALEKVMMAFVALMLLSFAVNLIRLKPDVAAMARGLVPSNNSGGGVVEMIKDLGISVLALIGTTFVISAAFYQAYLVRQKGWNQDDLQNGLIDARVGSLIMASITVMLMSTAAAGLYKGPGEKVVLKNPVEVATSLEPTFGSSGKLIFALGLFSAAYSSFIVNSMIGGFILADGLNMGSKPTDTAPRVFTALALLTGMVIGIAVVGFDWDRTPTIIAAQAVTVVGAPLIGVVLLWLTSSESIMGPHRNGPVTNVIATIGLLVLFAIGTQTAVKLYGDIFPAEESESEPAAAAIDVLHSARAT